jgi:hypothetical protein
VRRSTVTKFNRQFLVTCCNSSGAEQNRKVSFSTKEGRGWEDMAIEFSLSAIEPVTKGGEASLSTAIC